MNNYFLRVNGALITITLCTIYGLLSFRKPDLIVRGRLNELSCHISWAVGVQSTQCRDWK